MYGATPIEDISYYNVIVRQLTEWTSTSQQMGVDQTSINEGIGGVSFGSAGQFSTGNDLSSFGQRTPSLVNVRQKYIHGIDLNQNIVIATGAAGVANYDGSTSTLLLRGSASGAGFVPNGSGGTTNTLVPLTGLAVNTVHPTALGSNPIRRYQVQLALGIFNQEKLIPTKFMASQLAIEITLENPSTCMYYQPSVTWNTQPTGITAMGTPSATAPTYQVTNVNLIPEILEFDASYDESFLRGLQTGGVPIKFATWNNYRFSSNGISSFNLQIQERSRSVKSIFCLQRRDPPTTTTDSGASFFNTALGLANGASTFQEYQYRIGGRYFPAQAVQCSTDVGGRIPNGGCEAYVELAKALNTLGDTRLASNLNTLRWAMNPMTISTAVNSTHSLLSEFDYDYALVNWKSSGSPVVSKYTFNPSSTLTAASSYAGDLGSSHFAMAIDLETSNGLEISGLNAEEQSDISLIARFSDPQSSGFVFDVFTYIDSMIVLRENNVSILLKIGFRVDSISKMCDSFNKWVIMV